jgi:hypothetical protein
MPSSTALDLLVVQLGSLCNYETIVVSFRVDTRPGWMYPSVLRSCPELLLFTSSPNCLHAYRTSAMPGLMHRLPVDNYYMHGREKTRQA